MDILESVIGSATPSSIGEANAWSASSCEMTNGDSDTVVFALWNETNNNGECNEIIKRMRSSENGLYDLPGDFVTCDLFVDQLLPEGVCFVNDTSGKGRILSFAIECKLILWFAVWDFVDLSNWEKHLFQYYYWHESIPNITFWNAPWTIQWLLATILGMSFQHHRCHSIGWLLNRWHRYRWLSNRFHPHRSMQSHREFSPATLRRAWQHASQSPKSRLDHCHRHNWSMGQCGWDSPMFVAMHRSSRCNRDVGSNWQRNGVYPFSRPVWLGSVSRTNRSAKRYKFQSEF